MNGLSLNEWLSISELTPEEASKVKEHVQTEKYLQDISKHIPELTSDVKEELFETEVLWPAQLNSEKRTKKRFESAKSFLKNVTPGAYPVPKEIIQMKKDIQETEQKIDIEYQSKYPRLSLKAEQAKARLGENYPIVLRDISKQEIAKQPISGRILALKQAFTPTEDELTKAAADKYPVSYLAGQVGKYVTAAAGARLTAPTPGPAAFKYAYKLADKIPFNVVRALDVLYSGIPWAATFALPDLTDELSLISSGKEPSWEGLVTHPITEGLKGQVMGATAQIPSGGLRLGARVLTRGTIDTLQKMGFDDKTWTDVGSMMLITGILEAIGIDKKSAQLMARKHMASQMNKYFVDVLNRKTGDKTTQNAVNQLIDSTLDMGGSKQIQKFIQQLPKHRNFIIKNRQLILEQIQSDLDKGLPTSAILERAIPFNIAKQQTNLIEDVTQKIEKRKLEVQTQAKPINSIEINEQYEAFKDTWFGEKDWQEIKANVETTKIQKEIKQVAGEKRFGPKSQDLDYAMKIYVDLQNEPGHLEKFYADLSSEDRRIVDLSQRLTSEQKLVANKMAAEFEEVGALAQEEDVIHNLRDHYVDRLWDLKEPKQVKEPGRKFGVTTRHAKARKLKTILEGLASPNRLKLKVKGLSTGLNIYKKEIHNTIQDKQFIKKLKKMKTIDGDPLISTQQLPGTKRIEHPNFKTWTVIGKATPEAIKGRNVIVTPEGIALERQEIYAPKKIANNLNNIMGVSKLKGIKAIDTITKYNALAKAWVLQSSLFHPLAYLRSFYLGAKPLMAGEGFMDKLNQSLPTQAYKFGLQHVLDLSPPVELLVRNGMTIGLIPDWEEKILEEEQIFIGKMCDKHKASKVIKNKINAFRHQQAQFVFTQLGAGLKTQAAIGLLKNTLKKYPNMESNKAAKIVANLMNDDFGGLHLKRIGRIPTVQHIFRLFALAPDWTESNIRSFAKACLRGEEGEIYRRFWARIITKSILATAAAGIVLQGDELGDSYRKAWQDGKLKWMDVDITPIYKMCGGDTDAKYYFSIIGHFKDPLRFAIDPLKAAHYKGSIIYKSIFEGITGEDWADRMFTEFPDLLKTGKTVEYAPWKKSQPVRWTTLPSYLLHEIKQTQPIPAQNLINWWVGQLDGFQAITNSLGANIRKTYPEREKKKKKKKISRTKWPRPGEKGKSLKTWLRPIYGKE